MNGGVGCVAGREMKGEGTEGGGVSGQDAGQVQRVLGVGCRGQRVAGGRCGTPSEGSLTPLGRLSAAPRPH